MRSFAHSGLALPVLAGLVLFLAACSEYAFLDDFPEYAPTQPYLDEQALLAKRLEAQRLERERREREFRQRERGDKEREWDALQERQQRDVAAQAAVKERRARDRTKARTKSEDLAQWNRITGQ